MLPTQGPLLPTQGPLLPTRGPLLPTQGPLLPTRGPLLPTQCPLLPTQCPLLPTRGPLLPTQCPLLPTQCPLLPTRGPLLPTQCPLLPTRGPLLPTQCPLLPTQGPLLPTQGPLLPTQGPLLPTQCPLPSLLYFGNIHSWICAAQRLHARTSVTSYTSVNIYNFNSRLAHFSALWMEYIRSLRTGIMAEYPVMSTSQGTYDRIEQTSEAIRVTYEICRAGGREDWNWEPLIKGKIKILSFTQNQVVSKLHESHSSTEHKRRYFKEC